MGGTRFMVQWEEHPSHLATRLGHLLEHQTLVDVTLMCNTHTLRVHRAVLAACSPYFETILQRQLGMHPLIVLKDMQFSVLKSLIEFMYCGETSVTEDNLGPLLQAAKFFQVKGLSAMTKEALGLSSTGNKAVTGDAARKAFVGRSKRVPIQQNFVTKSLPSSSASSSQLTVDAKQIIQPSGNKSVIMQQPDNQQQTDTAQLLLSLSGSEFTKQTQSLQTVSKTIRFQNSVGTSSIKSEPVKTEPNIKPRTIKSEAVEQPTAVVPISNRTLSAQVPHQVTETVSVKDTAGAPAQTTFLAETIPARKRGRPVKRQMNIVFQEKVLTDADMALHKEAEASRKALEVLRQEMAVDPLEKASGAISQQPDPLRKITSHTGTATTMKMQMPVTPVGVTSSRAPSRIQTSSVKKPVSHTTYITKSIQKPAADPPRKVLVQEEQPNDAPKRVVNSPEQPPVQVVAPNTVSPATEQVPSDCSNANTNVIYQVANTVVSNQEMFQIVDNTNSQDKSQNIVYQVADGVTGSEADNDNTGSNIIYQMADSGNTTSVMGQYMEVLKEAGIPTDVPILLDSGDGSYVTVNEEMLMNIVNGGVFQCHVAEGNIVTGDRLEFIVQEVDGEGQQTAEQPVQNTAEQTATETAETSSLGVVSQVSEATHASVGRDMPTIEEDQSENILIENLSSDSNVGGIETFDSKTTVQEDTASAANHEVAEQKTVTVDGVALTENSVQPNSNSALDEAGGSETVSFENEVVDATQTCGSTENETVFKSSQSIIQTENLSFETGEVLHAENSGPESLDFNVQQDSTEIKSESSSAQNYEAGQLVEPLLKNVAIFSEEKTVKTQNDETTDDSEVTTTESDCVQENEVTFTYTDAAGLPSLDDYPESQESTVVSFEEKEITNKNENSNQSVIPMHSNVSVSDTLVSSVQVENIVYREVSDEVITGDPYGEDPSDGCLVQTATNIKTDETPEEFQNHNDIKDCQRFQNVTDMEASEQVTGQDQLHSSENSGMSVEQALEAMMGDENSDIQQDTGDNSEVAHRTSETTDASGDTEACNEKSNREELCLMLSRDEDAPKLDDQKCAAETGKVTGSFTLVVNSEQQKDDPDNTADTFISAPSTEVTENEDLNCTLSESENVNQEESDLTVEDTVANTSHCVGQERSVIVQNDNQNNMKDDETEIVSTVESICDNGKEVVVHDVYAQEAVETSEVQKITVSDITELPENYILLTDAKTEGQVISPNKDIPYAVGLLPLKTALEKFQSMPDHQPRKTRSSSTSKEGSADPPAARVKRKASSTEGGPDRKIRAVSTSAEETYEEVISSSGLQVQDNPSSWPSVDLNVEEHREGLHAMSEMVTEPTEV
ncbi:uncharacterized protein LOC124615174 [Schistocerca americana]|uniref:uncharacterized protein LOC124615174 n=1 Tax=Schistocerca americana TaxID=7009 RepID=UPI001F4F408D|nr:uncharacterized protein LOC124615174 [Schistocerca americana]